MPATTYTLGRASDKRAWFTPVTADVDFDALPESSKAFLIAYGIKQYLQDGMAGATEQKVAAQGVADRVAKLVSGETAIRASATPKPDPEHVVIIKVAREMATAAGFKKPAEMSWSGVADKMLAGPKGDAIRKEAARRMAAKSETVDLGDLGL